MMAYSQRKGEEDWERHDCLSWKMRNRQWKINGVGGIDPSV